MAILFTQVLPAGAALQMIDEVTDQMNVDSDPPEGMLVHVHYEKDGRVHIVDVWESTEAHEAFAESRLRPTMGKVAASHGMDMSQMPAAEESTVEVHRVVRGR